VRSSEKRIPFSTQLVPRPVRILIEHLRNVAATLREYGRQSAIAKHGDNSGAAREGIARNFLRNHLPESVSYLTGEIFDRRDSRSGQIDLIVHPSHAPRLHLIDDVNLVMADSVLAAIEVKSTLTTAAISQPSHLRSALDSCVRVKSLESGMRIEGLKQSGPVVLTRTPYFVFAFAGPTVETLREKLSEYQTTTGASLDLLPDLFTVLDREYYLVQNNGWLIDKVPDPAVHWSHSKQPEAVLLAMYAYLTQLIEAYGAHPRVTPISAYLRDLSEE
jgi:hypothetical protein